VYFNIILLSGPRSSFRIHDKNFVCSSQLLYPCNICFPSHPPPFDQNYNYDYIIYLILSCRPRHTCLIQSDHIPLALLPSLKSTTKPVSLYNSQSSWSLLILLTPGSFTSPCTILKFFFSYIFNISSVMDHISHQYITSVVLYLLILYILTTLGNWNLQCSAASRWVTDLSFRDVLCLQH
jgi:hypothetical protein